MWKRSAVFVIWLLHRDARQAGVTCGTLALSTAIEANEELSQE
jgi:hypothetical protein